MSNFWGAVHMFSDDLLFAAKAQSVNLTILAIDTGFSF